MSIYLPAPYPACRSVFIVSLLFGLLLLHNAGYCGETVSGSYISINNNRVVFKVRVGSTVPINLIIQHFHTGGIKLIKSSPTASKVANSQGFAKWFLKGVKSSSISFSLVFNKAVTRNQIKTVLRYRDPNSGNFVEYEVRP